MRQIVNKNENFQPLKSPDIDRSKSKPLTKTQSPINQILNHSSQLKVPNGLCHPLKSQQQSSTDSKSAQFERETVDLWISKYEYVKRDNQLLQSQIAYLNQHINRLTAAKKNEEFQFSKLLNEISKGFMQQIIQCQQTIRVSLQFFEEKLISSQDQIRKIKVQLNKNRTKNRPKSLDIPFSCQLQELFQSKIENTKLSARIKVLEEEIKDLGNKYISNFQWKFESFNFFNQLQRKIFNKGLSGSSPNEKLILPNSASLAEEEKRK